MSTTCDRLRFQNNIVEHFSVSEKIDNGQKIKKTVKIDGGITPRNRVKWIAGWKINFIFTEHLGSVHKLPP
jgi:hypothetical protein